MPPLKLKLFACKACGHYFTSALQLNEHQQGNKCKRLKAFSCGLCPFSSREESQLQKHIGNHFENLTCPCCKIKFKWLKNLKRHFLQFHCNLAEKYACKKCLKVFGRKDKYLEHEKSCLITSQNPTSKGSSGFFQNDDEPTKSVRESGNQQTNKTSENHQSHIAQSCDNGNKKTKKRVQGKGKLFTCNTCKQAFRGTKQYDNHRKHCNGKQGGQGGSPNESELSPHAVNTSGAKRKRPHSSPSREKPPEKCHFCSQQFSSRRDLYRHRLQVKLLIFFKFRQ